MANILCVSDALRYPGQEYTVEMAIELEDTVLSGDPIAFRDVVVKGIMTGAEEIVSLHAEVSARLISRCVRCLEDVDVPINAEIDVKFARAENPDDPDLYLFEGANADITDAVSDALIMEVPIQILCSPSCKGLCPSCGANRNLTSCTCLEGGAVASPFAALKSIVQNDEEV